MTDTAAAILRAVVADPSDDGARLVYADAIEEQGDTSRAEFVRLQLRLARVIEPHVCGRRFRSECWVCNFQRRERELLRANFGGWTDSLPESLVTKECPNCIDQPADWETNVVECGRCECTGLVPDDDRVEFRRGFVAHISCTCDDWLRHGPAIVLAQPVEDVTLADKRPQNYHNSGGSRLFGWYRNLQNEFPPRICVPVELWDLLLGRPRCERHGGWADFPTEAAALSALSQVCVRWARAEVGLPAWESKPGDEQ